ncbi:MULTISPECIES: tetratricopeptide repeat protein [unclassified Chelatococcus]|uniref:tetratricopeptide repeat protein n=1 Tax=unclassified Chelatococcus TaxID=2638111 RepID=UPI0020BF13CD|nr:MULTISPECIES: tetratricopeptide repeat protein [unclassified Chelatococcus]MCO5077171.1 tetratricopeptide repeat protein [Chelatococcus sp.]CAH1662056.1 Flp pilus assembly protein TadD, contains TPR repeat [Hyphomicrobiales bacterium]CAH1682859.1 Flp pilus assembly protein TadD, contains TPR repeat [Hyphomicrobiales bacterium]
MKPSPSAAALLRSPLRRRAKGRPIAGLALACMMSPLLGGCIPDLQKADITGSIFPVKRATKTAEPTEADWRELAEKSGKRYEANPDDKVAALAYGRSLREIGQHQQAVAVLRQAVLRAPQDQALLSAYGRALIDVGNLREAADVLARAHTQDKPDWRVLSAQGTVADQLGDHPGARRYYEAALRIAPDEPSVLSNLGLSYALSRNLPEAERALRQAAASPKADRRVRQNLALVLGLSGQTAEAESLLKEDMTPQSAARGAAYFKQFAGKPRLIARAARGADTSPPAMEAKPSGRAAANQPPARHERAPAIDTSKPIRQAGPATAKANRAAGQAAGETPPGLPLRPSVE